MLTASKWFMVVWVCSVALWIAAFVLHRKARRHYQGPTGLAQWRNPFGRFLSRNYTPAGAVIVRWELICSGAFVVSCLIGLAIAHTQFPAQHQ